MKKVFISIVFTSLLFSFNKTLNIGEVLEYEASFSNFNAGEGTLKKFWN